MSGLDLFLDQRVLVRMLLVAMAAGALVGLFFDLIAVLRYLCGDNPQKLPEGRVRLIQCIIRFVGDTLFSVVVSVAFLLVCYYTSDGQVRSPAIFGMLVGFFLYRSTIGRLIRKALYAAVRFLRKAIYHLVMAIVRVLCFLWAKLICPFVLFPLGYVAERLFAVTIGKLIARHRAHTTDRAIANLIEQATEGYELGKTNGGQPASPPSEHIV